MTNPFGKSFKDLVDRVFAPPDFGSIPLEDKWTVAVTLLADVLLRKDEAERETLLNSLWRELRAALHDIPRNDMTETKRLYCKPPLN